MRERERAIHKYLDILHVKLNFSENFSSVQYKKNQAGNLPRQFPPYNGWGSEEDSLCSCMGLLPKPPKRDFIKFMEKDRRGLDSNVLRFLARMNTTKPIDQERRFIISYYLSDDTISVFEPPVRNSGMYNSIRYVSVCSYFHFQNQQFTRICFGFLENYRYFYCTENFRIVKFQYLTYIVKCVFSKF